MAHMPVFQRRWFMFDFARQRTFDREEFRLFLDGLHRLGYNGLGLYLEGAFAFDRFPGVIRHGVMTPEDAAWAMEECKNRDIFLFPMTNVVGHMEHFFRQERFRDLLMADTVNQLDFLDDRAEQFAMDIVHQYTKYFPCGMIHIGGDETKLTEENKVPYAKFLAKICDNLLLEGIQPAIWNDMIWMDPELCQYFSRDVFIFDWSYYGHRPESMVFFRDLGFKDLVACPCDNSWEGFIHYQRIDGHLKSRTDIPVQPDEVEALFEDTAQAGIFGGCLTNWNSEKGRNFWGQWSAFARAALYMNGTITARESCDEKIELALFGRVTPYTEISHILQDELPMCPQSMAMRSALYLPKEIHKLFRMAVENGGRQLYDYAAVAQKVEQKLDSWLPQSEFERRCHQAMYGICALLRASSALLDAFNLYPLYAQAAKIQFAQSDQAEQMLLRIIGAFRSAISQIQTYRQIHGKATAESGHTRNDLMRLSDTIQILQTMVELLQEEADFIRQIPLVRFEMLLERAVDGVFLPI